MINNITNQVRKGYATLCVIHLKPCNKGNKPNFIMFKNIKIRVKYNNLILLHLMTVQPIP